MPIHLQLREQLVAEMDRYADGQKLPTEFELAGQFKVSRLTVHKVMADLQKDGYVTRQKGRGTFVSHGDRRIHTGTMKR